MYDILQLNDMLLPELIDIAESLKVTGAKKLEKQDLIYKILDKQAILNSAVKETKADQPQRKKRIVKTSTAISTEEAIVEKEGIQEPAHEEKKPKLEKKIGKRGRPSTVTQQTEKELNQKKTKSQHQ